MHRLHYVPSTLQKHSSGMNRRMSNHSSILITILNVTLKWNAVRSIRSPSAKQIYAREKLSLFQKAPPISLVLWEWSSHMLSPELTKQAWGQPRGNWLSMCRRPSEENSFQSYSNSTLKQPMSQMEKNSLCTLHSSLPVASRSHGYCDYATDYEIDLKRLLKVLKPTQLVNGGSFRASSPYPPALFILLNWHSDKKVLCRATNKG